MEVWIFEVAEQCGERWEEDSKRIDINPEGQWRWSQAVKGVARKRTGDDVSAKGRGFLRLGQMFSLFYDVLRSLRQCCNHCI